MYQLLVGLSADFCRVAFQCIDMSTYSAQELAIQLGWQRRCCTRLWRCHGYDCITEICHSDTGVAFSFFVADQVLAGRKRINSVQKTVLTERGWSYRSVSSSWIGIAGLGMPCFTWGLNQSVEKSKAVGVDQTKTFLQNTTRNLSQRGYFDKIALCLYFGY